jgi:hypothetical protein
MQYWCAVLLLHRPFIRHHLDSKNKQHSGSDKSDDGEGRTITEKSYELCAAAANHITSIVGVFVENHCLKRCSVFLCYYVFTASIMHVTTLMSHPSDPQARTGLKQCKEALRNIDIVWPSAGRALELLIGSKVNVGEESELAKLSRSARRAKRPLDDESYENTPLPNHHLDYFAQEIPTPGEYPTTHSAFVTPGSTNIPPAGSEVASYLSSFGRWPAGADAELPPLQGTLSTSVLPQLYSTGLGDGRGRAQSVNNRSYSTTSQNQNQRFPPQYWNDFSAYPQLGNAYGTVPRQPQTGLAYQMPFNMYSE